MEDTILKWRNNATSTLFFLIRRIQLNPTIWLQSKISYKRLSMFFRKSIIVSPIFSYEYDINQI